MPTKEFHALEPRQYEFTNSVIFYDRDQQYFRLRLKNDITGAYDSVNGRYNSSGTIVFPNFRADNLTELFSIESEVSGSGTVEYQLSNNNGITYYYVSASGVWTPTVGNYSPISDIDSNVSSFPFLFPKQIRIKAKLAPVNDRTLTPHLKALFINYEHDAGFVEDMERSLKHFLNQRLSVKYDSRLKVVSGTTNYTLEIPNGSTFYDCQSIHNISTDSNRQTNLLSATTSGGILTLTTPQVSGTMLVKYRATVPVYLGAEIDLHDSIKPSIVINRRLGIDLRAWRTGDDVVETSLSQSLARVRPHPDFEEIEFTIECQHGSRHDATKMTDALRSLISSKKIVQSHGTGQDFKIRLYEPTRSVDSNVYSNMISLRMYGFNDINRNGQYSDPSGVAIISDTVFAGSGTEDRFDTYPLVAEDGISFNIKGI